MIQTFTFQPGGRQVNARGATFVYESGAAAGESLELRVRADGQDLGTLLPGDRVRLPAAASLWELVPVSAVCSGVVRIGLASFDSGRVSGSIEVREASPVRVLRNLSFVLAQRNIWSDTLVGSTPHFQLFNPAASGRALLLRSFRSCARADFPGRVFVGVNNVPRILQSTDGAGAGIESRGVPVAARSGVIGSTVGGVAQIRGHNVTLAINESSYAATVVQLHLINGRDQGVEWVNPLVLYPGQGLDFVFSHVDGSANNNLHGGMWWRTLQFDETPLTEL